MSTSLFLPNLDLTSSIISLASDFTSLSSELKKKSGGFMKATKATAAVMTGGLSLAAEAAVKVALKPEDRIFKFEDLRSYEILMDDESVTKGGLGMAAAGGLLFGAAGGIAGSVMGKKKQRKLLNS